MNKYRDDKGEVVEVTHGLGDWWIVARGRHRVKTAALPPRKSADECQRDLDAYATKKRWHRLLAVEVPSNAPRLPPERSGGRQDAVVGAEMEER